MSVADLRASFAAGEISPSLWGRADLAKWKVALSVGRNGFVSYRGGWSSRAGTMFVAQSKQPASANSVPPRLIKFQFNIYQSYALEFGDGYMRVHANGAAITETPRSVTGATQANPGTLTVPAHGYANGDWVYAAGVGGMTQLNGRTFIVANAATNTFQLTDTFGVPVNTLQYGAFTGGGTVARIYTNTNSPYAAADLPYLKVVQSADVMSLCCVNQQTGKEYPTYDLQRLAANNWNFSSVSFVASIGAPPTCAVTTTTGGATQYAYCVTAIDDITGEESIASPVAYMTTSADIALTAGSHTITWTPVAGASQYNVYVTTASYDTPVPSGSAFGFLGDAFGTQFVNSNILPDFTKSPPTHTNPFAQGTIISVKMTAQGASYAQLTTTAAVTSASGTGALIIPIIVGGAIVACLVQDGGAKYQTGDVVVFTDTASGTGATATVMAGPETGTYPGVVGYFQQRRYYGYTLNNPDTIFGSQVGAYKNFDASTPPVDSDAITSTPWGLQVNGVQWLQPMPGGLIVATGLDAWQLSGTAGVGSPVTPSQESAAQQESNGFSPTLPPLKINYDILYVSSFATAVFDLAYNYYINIYAGTDISVMSNHLFDSYQIEHWAYAKQPFKVIWATRDDGKFLSLTFLKEQDVLAWCRHDTNGQVVGVETIDEPPVTAPYFIIKRYIVGAKRWAYYIERMDNREWDGPEDPWCVDCGLALPQPTPNATLSASAAAGPGTITGAIILDGGQKYVNPVGTVVDPLGIGSGAVVTLSVQGDFNSDFSTDFAIQGLITGAVVVSGGANYSPGSYLRIDDQYGGGAVVQLTVSQNVIFDATGPVFASANIGDVIRIGGGQAIIQAINSPTQVLAAITVPLTKTIPNDPNNLPFPAAPGDWTLTTPVSTITNLEHIEGMQVAVLADGAVVAGGEEPLITVQSGTIVLPQPASSIKVGLPFVAQAQTMHYEASGQPTVQGKRKRVHAATVRMEKSRGAEIGADQPVAAALSGQPEIAWQNMQRIPDVASAGVPAAALPLFTGDRYLPVDGDWHDYTGVQASPGMVAVQQRNPLPLNLLALVPQYEVGDTDG